MTGRFDAFHELEPEKQKRILDAALKEFSEKGFKRASTNAIAESAQIGKGMLFYYFGSKGELFDFLCGYCIEFFRREYLDRFLPRGGDDGDFIRRQQRMAELKRKAMGEIPLIFHMFESFYRPENAAYIKKYAEPLAEQRRQFIQSLYEGLDLSLLRADLEPLRALRYITWLMDSYTAEIERKAAHGDLDAADEAALAAEWARYDAFTEDLRKLFYHN
ncbi:MAG: TetR/AcrR family transcriptional regulator [Firmicutes bacterium]|nr:TetR/AcrR family transcriptional regulator [Bacillota bacterium]